MIFFSRKFEEVESKNHQIFFILWRTAVFLLANVHKLTQKNAGIIHFKFKGRCGVSQNGSEESLRRTVADFLDEQTRTFTIVSL
jgi:hypothetical protein